MSRMFFFIVFFFVNCYSVKVLACVWVIVHLFFCFLVGHVLI